MAAFRAGRWNVPLFNTCWKISGGDSSTWWSFTRSIASRVACRLRQDGRGVRRARRFVCCSHATIQHDHFDGPTHAECPAFVRAIRAGSNGRADPGQIAASKRKGMWMGGVPPLGYDVRDRRLVVNRPEAVTVKHIYERYLELGSVEAPEKRFKAPRDCLQSPGVEKRRPDLEAGNSRAELFMSCCRTPDLPRRDPPQEGTPSRAAPADSEPRALGEGPTALARSGRHASRTPNQGAAQPARG